MERCLLAWNQKNHINIENLVKREERQDIDLVEDEVDGELSKVTKVTDSTRSRSSIRSARCLKPLSCSAHQSINQSIEIDHLLDHLQSIDSSA